jgi:FtsP/CotA-like multicopper oxidase with cupredoxin domain
MDLNDVDFDAFLANDRTLTDPEVVRVGRGGRVHLRIINAASSSQFWIDLGVRIAFDADNPGRWAFHCHNLYHVQTGMMAEVRYEGIAA